MQWWLALCISIVYLMLPLFSSQYFMFVEVSFNISAYILFTYHAPCGMYIHLNWLDLPEYFI